MTEAEEKRILYLLGETRNPLEVSRDLKVHVSDVRAVMRSGLPPLPGWGRLELQTYIVSRRRSYDPHWPLDDLPTLQDCRRQHDQGRVTMCQGRDGNHILQYAIPSHTPIRRAPYFYGAPA